MNNAANMKWFWKDGTVCELVRENIVANRDQARRIAEKPVRMTCDDYELGITRADKERGRAVHASEARRMQHVLEAFDAGREWMPEELYPAAWHRVKS